MMVSADVFYGYFRRLEEKIRRAAPRVEYAVVSAIEGGKPLLTFSGESEQSQKKYPFPPYYVPEIGDRVMLQNGIVVTGGWNRG